MRGKIVLVIDDDAQVCHLVERSFSREGAQVLCAAESREGLRKFIDHRPDLILLDPMMPHLDDWEICRQIRRVSNIPILILTAMDGEKDVILGLNHGADDYITKPFSIQVLLARARAALRRAKLPPYRAELKKTSGYHDDYLDVNIEKGQVAVRGKTVRLTKTEFHVLKHLIENAGSVVSIAEILEKVWGSVYQNDTSYVHVYLSRLRHKIEKDPKNPIYLRNEHGMGYRFVDKISEPFFDHANG